MKTIVLQDTHQFRLIDAEPPMQPGRDEALVRVRRVGICGTDLHAFEGTQPFFSYPRILGHELALEIEALGPTDLPHALAVGDRCTVEPYLNCGHCVACRRGRTNCCESMQVLGVHRDGGMRERFIVPINKLHAANDLPLESLALVEMLSIGAHAVRRAALEHGENTLVIGAGPIGLGVLRFAKLAGANVAAMDINTERLAFCEKHLAVTATIDARQPVEPRLRELFDGELPTAVLDATGSAKSMMNAFNFVAHSGRLVYVGLNKLDITFPDPLLHSREMTLLASRNATAADFDWVLSSMRADQFDATPWVTHQATPDSLIDQFPGWLLPETGVIKAMLSFDA